MVLILRKADETLKRRWLDGRVQARLRTYRGWRCAFRGSRRCYLGGVDYFHPALWIIAAVDPDLATSRHGSNCAAIGGRGGHGLWCGLTGARERSR